MNIMDINRECGPKAPGELYTDYMWSDGIVICFKVKISGDAAGWTLWVLTCSQWVSFLKTNPEIWHLILCKTIVSRSSPQYMDAHVEGTSRKIGIDFKQNHYNN